jgi:aldose 1-epimerase
VNHLHGGPKGYYDVVWTANQLSNSKIVFTYTSPDGEQGYPGKLDITMTYELTADNGLKIEYSATTDKATICNLTNHSYFNLSGEGAETINDHLLMINASNFTPVDSTLIPTGELTPVAGTPMDFTKPIAIGARVKEEYQQLKFGGGYDHNWVINKQGEGVEMVATLESPVTGIKMEVYTDQPGIQFYGGNFLDGDIGKSGKPYAYRSALCLETQHFPDSPNKPQFPSTLLLPGQKYSHTCIYKFSK